MNIDALLQVVEAKIEAKAEGRVWQVRIHLHEDMQSLVFEGDVGTNLWLIMLCKNPLLFIIFLYLAFKFPPYSLETDWYNVISIIFILELILGIFVLKLEISRKLQVVVTSCNGSMVWHVAGQVGKFEDLGFDPKCTRMVEYLFTLKFEDYRWSETTGQTQLF